MCVVSVCVRQLKAFLGKNKEKLSSESEAWGLFYHFLDCKTQVGSPPA
jgi:hypothetical protein